MQLIRGGSPSKGRAQPLSAQAYLLVSNLDTIFRRLLFSRVPNEPDIELPMRDFRALVAIEAEGPLAMADLAAALGMPVSTATHTVSRLEKKGFLERERSEPDRRVVHVSLTEEGAALVRLHLELRRAMARDMLRPLASDERGHFLHLLGKISRLATVTKASPIE